jgi:hypothetical protein
VPQAETFRRIAICRLFAFSPELRLIVQIDLKQNKNQAPVHGGSVWARDD